VAAVWVALAASTGCGDEPGADGAPDAGDASPDVVADGPTLIWSDEHVVRGGDDAQVQGRVSTGRDCVTMRSGTVTGTFLVVWPQGSRWDGAGRRVVLPDGAAVVDGSQVDGGGGYVPVGDVDRLGPDAADAVARCGDQVAEIAVFNAAEPVRVS